MYRRKRFSVVPLSMGACIEMYSDAQKCSDFAQEFRDVKLHFPCPVEILSE